MQPWKRASGWPVAELSPKMAQALELLKLHGWLAAGANGHVKPGWSIRISSSTLLGLERRGLCFLSISPDGGMMATRKEVPF